MYSEVFQFGCGKYRFLERLEEIKGLNNRAKNSHLPLRKRERTMQGFRSVGELQRFVSIFRQSEISSFRRTRNAQLSPPTFIEYAPWRSGKP
jgi:transposase-like protein